MRTLYQSIIDEDRTMLRQVGAEMHSDRIAGRLVFWQDEHGKLPVRFGIVEEYKPVDPITSVFVVRSGRATTVVDAEKIKFVGVGNVVD